MGAVGWAGGVYWVYKKVALKWTHGKKILSEGTGKGKKKGSKGSAASSTFSPFFPHFSPWELAYFIAGQYLYRRAGLSTCPRATHHDNVFNHDHVFNWTTSSSSKAEQSTDLLDPLTMLDTIPRSHGLDSSVTKAPSQCPPWRHRTGVIRCLLQGSGLAGAAAALPFPPQNRGNAWPISSNSLPTCHFHFKPENDYQTITCVINT